MEKFYFVLSITGRMLGMVFVNEIQFYVASYDL